MEVQLVAKKEASSRDQVRRLGWRCADLDGSAQTWVGDTRWQKRRQVREIKCADLGGGTQTWMEVRRLGWRYEVLKWERLVISGDVFLFKQSNVLRKVNDYPLRSV